jgi:hypothetical protein
MKKDLLLGLAVSNAAAMLIIALTTLIPEQQVGVIVFSEFIIIPFGMGIISAWFWRNLQLSSKGLSWCSCLNAFVVMFFYAKG